MKSTQHRRYQTMGYTTDCATTNTSKAPTKQATDGPLDIWLFAIAEENHT